MWLNRSSFRSKPPNVTKYSRDAFEKTIVMIFTSIMLKEEVGAKLNNRWAQIATVCLERTVLLLNYGLYRQRASPNQYTYILPRIIIWHGT